MAEDLFGGALPTVVPIEDMITEVRRELRLRDHVYPNLVSRRKLTKEAAERQTLRLQAVLQGLLELQACTPLYKVEIDANGPGGKHEGA